MDFKARYQYNPKSDLLGKGGFAIVYKATDNLLNRTVALKFFTVTNVHNNSLIKEISRAIALNHQNLCRYFDAALLESTNMHGEIERIEVGVMEYIDGGELKQYYGANPAHLTKLLIDILQGLSYLHSNNIIHRDLKPQNILIKNTSYGPMAKITDFGISKTITGDNTKSQLMGTVEYMAPEQFSPLKYGINGRIGTNLDLWSFGLMVYELIEGKTLFGGDGNTSSAEQIMSNILNQELAEEKFKKLPEPYRKVVRMCVVKDAKQRAQTADELIEILRSPGEKKSKLADMFSGSAKAKPAVPPADEVKVQPKAHGPVPEAPKAPEKIMTPAASAGETMVFPDPRNRAATPAAQGETIILPNIQHKPAAAFSDQGETRILPNVSAAPAAKAGNQGETMVFPKDHKVNDDASATVPIKTPETRNDLFSKQKQNESDSKATEVLPSPKLAPTFGAPKAGKKKSLLAPIVLLAIAVIASVYFLVFNKRADDSDGDSRIVHKDTAAAVSGKSTNTTATVAPAATAGSGDDSTSYKLAVNYYDKGQYDDAAKAIQPLAQKNRPEALTLLGNIQYESAMLLYKKNDFAPAFQLFNKSAVTSNPKAQCMLGTMYFQGQGVPKSDIQALEWYLKSSDQKNEVAMYMLGYFYAEGIAVKQSTHSAKKFLQWEVDNGKDKPTRDAAIQKLAALKGE